MTKKKEAQDVQQAVELHLNPSLAPIWIDNINVGIREDNLLLIRFLANMPEGVIEQSKIMTSNDAVKRFINILCDAVNYYPEFPNKKSSSEE